MVVSVTTSGVTTTNIVDFSVQEDATTIDPGNLTGGTGQISVTLDSVPNPRQLLTKPLTLDTGEVGSMLGTVRDVTGGSALETISATADTKLALFNAWRSVKSFTGTLSNAFAYYFSLIPSAPSLIVESSISARSVTFPGWEGNLWDGLKQICAAEQIEIAQTGNFALVRPLRTKNYTLVKSTQPFQWVVNQQTTAKKVRIHYYGNSYRNDGEVFPVPATPPLPGEDMPEVTDTIYTIDTGERQVTEITLSASLDYVNQPTCVDFVYDQDYSGTNGVYAVVGNDDLPITAAQWTAEGGSLTVEVMPNPSIIKMTLVGANIPDLAPFRIAMSAGSGSYYNSLHLTGDGVFQVDQAIDIWTGAGEQVTGEDIGAEVTNPFIDTLGKALYTGQQTAGRYALTHTLSGSVDALLDSTTGAAGELGTLAGGAIYEDNSRYRISSVGISTAEMSVSAEMDVLTSDFNTLGLTTAQFNALWSGKSCLDFSLEPLRK